METSQNASELMGEALQNHNQTIMAQINNQLLMAYAGKTAEPSNYVIRNQATGVLCIVSSSTITAGLSVVFGPSGFRQCTEYVNSAIVTRLAETSELPQTKLQQEQ